MSCNPVPPKACALDENALCEQFEKCAISEKKSPAMLFLQDFPKNSFLAYGTIPLEDLAVRRLKAITSNPTATPPSYYSVIRSVGASGLFAGAFARTAYCFSGNLATLIGNEQFGVSSLGILATSACKNIILPLSLWSNAAQTNTSLKETIEFIKKDTLCPKAHGAFFARNAFSIWCLSMGFKASDLCYEHTDNVALSKVFGVTTASTIAGVANAFLKPFFFLGTGTPGTTRLLMASKLPALAVITLRESVSALFQFAHREPQKTAIKQ